jgi:hypothetical protein
MENITTTYQQNFKPIIVTENGNMIDLFTSHEDLALWILRYDTATFAVEYFKYDEVRDDSPAGWYYKHTRFNGDRAKWEEFYQIEIPADYHPSYARDIIASELVGTDYSVKNDNINFLDAEQIAIDIEGYENDPSMTSEVAKWREWLTELNAGSGN